MRKQQHFMETEPVGRLLFQMSLPMMISMLIQSLYNIVDSIYVSRLGTQALTAVSLAFPLQNIVLSVAVGTGIGISAVISVSLGEKNDERANAAASWGALLSLLHCVAFAILGVFVTKPFLSLFTQNDAILQQACSYTYLVLCFSFGCLLQIAMEKIYQGLGAMKITMLLMGTGCIVNIILDPILIFGYLGLPAMGVTGAAIATVIGQITALALYIILFIRKNPGVEIHMQYLKASKGLVKKIYAIAIPSSCMMMMPSLLIGVLNGMLATVSDLYVAVLGLYFKLQTFIYMPASGLIQGMRPLVGYNYGAGRKDRVRSMIRYSLLVAAILMLGGTALSLAVPRQILSLFDADSDLLSAGADALKIISIGFPFSAVSIVFSGMFEAMGKGLYSLLISLLRQLLITLVLGWMLLKWYGVFGVWAAFPIAETAAAVVALLLVQGFQNGSYALWSKGDRRNAA